jgi:uncharacterized membrane protein YphA (DoxX/SURF4 family)
MRIYNYLFFKGYQLAVRSGNYDGMLVEGAMSFVILCVMLNIFTLSFLLEGLDIVHISFEKKYKYVFSLGLALELLAYYLYRGRYKTIISKYEQREQTRKRCLHPITVLVLYYSVSFGLLLLAGLFRNGDWIFSK